MILKRALLPLSLALLMIGGAQADTPGDASAQVSVPVSADSCAAAFATVMAEYLRPELEKQFPGDTAAVREFVKGVEHAFEIKNEDAPYFFGVRSGFALIDRVEAMQAMGFPFTSAQFCSGLEAALRGSAMGFDGKSADEFLRTAVERMRPAMEEAAAVSAESQKEFLDAQRSRPGVSETSSGLLFEIITEGEGEAPGDADKVRVIYTGRLADGTVFDETNRPIEFPLQGLVPGFSEGLKMMKPGGEYRLFIPASLGYGERGAAGVIPPGAALDFTVKLLDVLKAGTSPAGASQVSE